MNNWICTSVEILWMSLPDYVQPQITKTRVAKQRWWCLFLLGKVACNGCKGLKLHFLILYRFCLLGYQFSQRYTFLKHLFSKKFTCTCRPWLFLHPTISNQMPNVLKTNSTLSMSYQFSTKAKYISLISCGGLGRGLFWLVHKHFIWKLTCYRNLFCHTESNNL